jgi:acylphosphatase
VTDEVRRVHLLVEGRVQGVFFRDATRREALSRGVSGWVRNLPDGRVEAVYEGEASAVSGLLEWTWTGTPEARVTHVETREETPVEERGFLIR